jgi:hypothetical protein
MLFVKDFVIILLCFLFTRGAMSSQDTDSDFSWTPTSSQLIESQPINSQDYVSGEQDHVIYDEDEDAEEEVPLFEDTKIGVGASPQCIVSLGCLLNLFQ